MDCIARSAGGVGVIASGHDQSVSRLAGSAIALVCEAFSGVESAGVVGWFSWETSSRSRGWSALEALEAASVVGHHASVEPGCLHDQSRG